MNDLSPVVNVSSLGRSIHKAISITIVLSIIREDKLKNDPRPNFSVVREGRSIQYINSFS